MHVIYKQNVFSVKKSNVIEMSLFLSLSGFCIEWMSDSDITIQVWNTCKTIYAYPRLFMCAHTVFLGAPPVSAGAQPKHLQSNFNGAAPEKI